MKSLLFASAALALVTAACGAQPTTSSVASLQTPDMYTCTGTGVTVYYGSTSFDGRPTLSIVQDGLTNLDVRGDDIKIARQARGTLLSAVKYIPDFATITYKLNLPKAAVGATFATTLQTVTSPTSIAGPLPGQHDSTANVTVNCSAAFANF